MKLIVSGNSLSRKLIQLIKKHEALAFAVAWAGVNNDVYKTLMKYRQKVWRGVIGTHFHQTHPDVIKDFIQFRNVSFVFQPQGVFHPKAYLFWTDTTWDMLIGSANLTSWALSHNSEVMLHLSSVEGPQDFQKQLKNQIEEYWKNYGEMATAESEKKYRKMWEIIQPALRRISGTYSKGGKSKSPLQTEIMSMTWDLFYERVKDDPHHGFVERCDLLDTIRTEFKKHDSYKDMSLNLQKTIAGLPNKINDHWAWFGSMKGAVQYKEAVNRNDPHLSTALNMIPFEGPIVREHYDSFVQEFKKAFPGKGHGVALASRLLAMKRPDYFVCLDSKNREQLCLDFGIKKSGMTYDRYWEEVVCRITDSIWWNEPKPTEKKARSVWQGRAAMLDAIYYEP